MLAVCIPTYGRPQCLDDLMWCLGRSRFYAPHMVVVGRCETTPFEDAMAWSRIQNANANNKRDVVVSVGEPTATLGEKRDNLVRWAIEIGATEIVTLDDDDLCTDRHVGMLHVQLQMLDVVMRKTHFSVKWDERKKLREIATSSPYGAQAFTARAYLQSGGYPWQTGNEDSELRQRFKEMSAQGEAKVGFVGHAPTSLIVRRFPKDHHHVSRTRSLAKEASTHFGSGTHDPEAQRIVEEAEEWTTST